MLNNYKQQLSKLKQVEPEAFKLAQIRNKLADYLAFRPTLKIVHRPQLLARIFKPVYVAAICLVLLAVNTTAMAATQALPNQLLYPVKKAMENMQVALITSPPGKIQARLALAEKRIQEAEQVVALSNSSAVLEALSGYQEEIKTLINIVVDEEPNKTNLLTNTRQRLIKQQDRLTKLANKASHVEQAQRQDIEDRVVEALNDNNDKEGEVFNKVVAWLPPVVPVIQDVSDVSEGRKNIKSSLKSSVQAEVADSTRIKSLILESGVPIEVNQPHLNLVAVEAGQKIQKSEQLWLSLQAPLSELVDAQNQKQLIKLSERAQEALREARVEYDQLINNEAENYMPVYRQTLQAYKLILELQVRLNYVNNLTNHIENRKTNIRKP